MSWLLSCFVLGAWGDKTLVFAKCSLVLPHHFNNWRKKIISFSLANFTSEINFVTIFWRGGWYSGWFGGKLQTGELWYPTLIFWYLTLIFCIKNWCTVPENISWLNPDIFLRYQISIMIEWGMLCFDKTCDRMKIFLALSLVVSAKSDVTASSFPSWSSSSPPS